MELTIKKALSGNAIMIALVVLGIFFFSSLFLVVIIIHPIHFSGAVHSFCNPRVSSVWENLFFLSAGSHDGGRPGEI